VWTIAENQKIWGERLCLSLDIGFLWSKILAVLWIVSGRFFHIQSTEEAAFFSSSIF
jgi:hypothetical protein